jgi:ABC-type transport system involved in multi-copper enzyme maturation permease subunit
MPLRLGPGPVFVYEALTAARRWQPYAMRAVFVALILIGMAIVQADIPRSGPDHRVSLGDLALLGENLYKVVAWIELTLVLLAAPAATAGAVCHDKARGTLDHMLATDLSNAEIVLGKLGVRLIPVLGLVACALPVLALAGLLGGIEPMALFGLFVVAIGCAVLGCALAMALSVYGRKTHEVVMMAYVFILLWAIAPILLEIAEIVLLRKSLPPPPPGVAPGPPPAVSPLWGILQDGLSWSHPYILAFAPYDTPGRVDGMTYLGFLAGCLALSAALVVLAMARVRRVALKQAARPASDGRRRRWRALARIRLPGPSLDRNPVAWREWHCSRTSPMMRIAWGMYAVLGLSWFGLAAWLSSRDMPRDHASVGLANMVQVTVGLLLLSVAATSSLAEERGRGSLDVLLSTPMPTRSILAGKWWGGFRRVFFVAIWPAATTALLAHDSGYWGGYLLLLGLVLAHGAVITSLGLAMATWVNRPGRAIALCVTIHVLSMIGWPILLSIAFRGYRTVVQALLVGDPPVGVLFATMGTSASGFELIGPGINREEFCVWAFGWIVVLAVVAATLFGATLATFDGCLERIPDDGLRLPPRPRGRSSLSTDELLALVPSADEDEER